jgi:hypothetical protein
MVVPFIALNTGTECPQMFCVHHVQSQRKHDDWTERGDIDVVIC